MHRGIVSLYVDVNHHKKELSVFECTSMLQDSEKHKANKSYTKLNENFPQNIKTKIDMEALPTFDQLQFIFLILKKLNMVMLWFIVSFTFASLGTKLGKEMHPCCSMSLLK